MVYRGQGMRISPEISSLTYYLRRRFGLRSPRWFVFNGWRDGVCHVAVGTINWGVNHGLSPSRDHRLSSVADMCEIYERVSACVARIRRWRLDNPTSVIHEFRLEDCKLGLRIKIPRMQIHVKCLLQYNKFHSKCYLRQKSSRLRIN